jgi:hypothetical protein
MAIGYNGIPTYFSSINQPTYNGCLAVVKAAQAEWVGMVQQFAAENIAMGITQAGKTLLIGNALQVVNTYGASGSLWEAYNALSQVVITPEMAPFLTQERIDWMKNQMVQVISTLP